MPKKAHNVSPSQALEALHVFSTLATAAQDTYPPFSYGSAGPGAKLSPNIFQMTPTNSRPALVVWLFLVTNPKFLNQLIDPQPGDPLVSTATIAQATNLTVPTVQAILDIYINSSPDPTVDNNLRQSFERVTAAFQDYAASAGYGGGNCPGNGGWTIIGLAQEGATVDPTATDPNA